MDGSNSDLSQMSSRSRVQAPSPPQPLCWPYVEDRMKNARDLRANFQAESMAMALRFVWRTLLPRRSPRWLAVVRGMMLVALVALCVAALATRVSAQDLIDTSLEEGSDGSDRAALAQLDLDAATIESCDDVRMLWRAVRELVLPQRVSEQMQQRILRRVWIVDPAIRESSVIHSAAN